MKLDKLLMKLEFKTIQGNTNPEINGIAYDSRLVSEGYLFVAIKGLELDGHDYIEKAIKQGATVILGEDQEKLKSCGADICLYTKDARRALAIDQVMMPFDYDMAQMLHEHIAAKGVKLELSNGVKTFEYLDGKTKVTLQDGKEIVTDLVILSIGIKPNGELAKEAGLTVNQRGGIVVDDYLRTSDESIYALGDVIQVKHYIDGEDTMIDRGDT